MTSERIKSRTSSEESPEEAKQHMKEKVSRGVAKVAGALEGFTSKAKEEHLAEKAGEAIQKAGETTRNVTKTGREEIKETWQAIRGSGPASGQSGASAPFGRVGSKSDAKRMMELPPSPTRTRPSAESRPQRFGPTGSGHEQGGERSSTTGDPAGTTPAERKYETERRQS